MIVDEIFKQIDAGRAGENHGYSMGLPKLEGIIDNNLIYKDHSDISSAKNNTL